MPKAVSISIATLPSVEHLKTALACVASDTQSIIDEGVRRLGLSSTDKLRKYAKIAREWSKKCCAFCGTERPKSKVKDGDWTGYELCACLKGYTGTYRQHYPWRDIPALIAKINKGEVSKDTIAYSDTCVTPNCNTRFEITVDQIRVAHARHEQYNQSRRCLKCIQAHKAAKHAKQQQQPQKSLKKAKHPQHKPAPNGLVASVGQMLAAKASETPPEIAQA